MKKPRKDAFDPASTKIVSLSQLMTNLSRCVKTSGLPGHAFIAPASVMAPDGTIETANAVHTQSTLEQRLPLLLKAVMKTGEDSFLAKELLDAHNGRSFGIVQDAADGKIYVSVRALAVLMPAAMADITDLLQQSRFLKFNAAAIRRSHDYSASLETVEVPAQSIAAPAA